MNLKEFIKNLKGFDENSPYFADFYLLFNRIISDIETSTKKNNKHKVIMITSAMEKEGKSTLASLASVTGAIASKEYHLLVDGDLRKPTLHKQFDVKLGTGLSDILKNGTCLSSVVRPTSHKSLHLITAGKHVDKPFELLSSDKVNRLFDDLRKYYKLVIIDSPPVIPVSDALKFGPICDGVVIIVKAGKTPRDIVKRAIDIVKQNQCQLLGVVLNDVGGVLPYYYHRKYYKSSYHYSNYVVQKKK